ncbi:MAG: endonuclease/exonuclease/phosphatase family protein [Puniceicoccales bacterium]|jgi:endonuclease/exonuclease/phosphatase family metal-dependent hydrolase|nr:endonuclease/exonuclease/phosphatase family protein [Puniceicoccales bacterium]
MTHRRFLTALLAALLAPAFTPAANAATAAAPANAAAPAAKQQAAPATPLALKLVTFNLRFRGPGDTRNGNGWDDTRRPAVAAVLRRLDADIFGTQEGLAVQLHHIASDLPAYAWAGVGRDDGRKRGEFSAIFYKKERFDLLETQHFWLSETPTKPGSRSWNSACARMVTAVRLCEKTTGRQLWFLNSHFDHVSELARQKSAELILERIKKFDPAIPVFLTADFNAAAVRSETYKALTASGAFLDTWVLAARRLNSDYNTYQGFNRNPKRNKAGGSRIDWILVRPAAGSLPPRVSRSEIVIDRRPDGGFPSDHFPVTAILTLR